MPAFLNQLSVPAFENADARLRNREPAGLGLFQQSLGNQRSDGADRGASAVRLEGSSVPTDVQADQLGNGQAESLHLGGGCFRGHGLRHWVVRRRSDASLALSSSGSAGHPSGKRHAQCFEESHGSLPCVSAHISLRYTSPVTSKKGVIGIGVPLDHCDESRSFCSAEHAASLSVPQFMVARTGERKLRQLTQVVTGTPTRSSYRPQLALGAVVVAKLTTWSPLMAHTASLGAAAPVSGADALIVDVSPDTGWLAYRGTRAQLEAEGLIPSDFQWPEAYNRTSWFAGVNAFRLVRTRPALAKGSRKQMATNDYWSLRISMRHEPVGHHYTRDIWRQAEALKLAIYRATPAGIAAAELEMRCILAAKNDQVFQSVLAACLPATRKTSRGAKHV